MRETIRIGILGLALLGGVSLVTGLMTAPPVALADAIDDQIKEVTTAAKKAKEGEERAVIAKMNELGDNPDKRITKMFASLCKNKRTKIASLAMKKGAKRKDGGVLKTLKSIVKNKKVAKGDPDRYIAALEAIGMYEDKSTADVLEDVIKKYLPKNSFYSVPAIEAYGGIQEKAVIEQLIKWLAQTGAGNNSGSGGGGGGGGGGSISPETRDNYAKASSAIVGALTDLTHEEIADAQSWKAWWDDNKKGFEFKDAAEVVEEELDYATLTEYVDKVYGWSVKKPDAPLVRKEETAGWAFVDPAGDKDIRAKAVWKDEKDYQFSSIEFRIFNTVGKNIKTPKGLVDHWTKSWEKHHYSEFSKEPEQKEVKLGGRDWVMAHAKGMAGGRSKNWGAMESRIYVTQVRHLLLYSAGRWRIGAEEDIKKQCIELCEGVKFTESDKKKKTKKKK